MGYRTPCFRIGCCIYPWEFSFLGLHLRGLANFSLTIFPLGRYLFPQQICFCLPLHILFPFPELPMSCKVQGFCEHNPVWINLVLHSQHLTQQVLFHFSSFGNKLSGLVFCVSTVSINFISSFLVFISPRKLLHLFKIHMLFLA